MKFFNWMVSEDAELFFSFGIEGEDYQVTDGKPVFEVPTDAAGADKMRYLNYWLWLVQDTTYNKRVSELSDSGKELIDAFDNMLSNEGRRGIEFDPRLEAMVKYPELNPKSDELPPLILEHVLRMVYGRSRSITTARCSRSICPRAVKRSLRKQRNDITKKKTLSNRRGMF